MPPRARQQSVASPVEFEPFKVELPSFSGGNNVKTWLFSVEAAFDAYAPHFSTTQRVKAVLPRLERDAAQWWYLHS